MRLTVSVWHVGVLGQCSPYITVRVRRYLAQLCYECGLKPIDLRAILCRALKKQPDQNKDSLWMASASSNSQPSLSMSANVDSIIPQKAHILTMTRWSNATFLDLMPAIPRASCIPRKRPGITPCVMRPVATYAAAIDRFNSPAESAAA